MRNVFRLWMLLCACAVGAQDAALVNTNGALVFPTNFLSANGIAPLASPALSGNPTAPTETAGDNDTSISTTAFVTAAIEALKALQLWQDTNAVLTTLAALTGGNSSNFWRGDGTFAQVSSNDVPGLPALIAAQLKDAPLNTTTYARSNGVWTPNLPASQLAGLVSTSNLPGLLSSLSVGNGGGVVSNLAAPTVVLVVNTNIGTSFISTNITFPDSWKYALIQIFATGGPGGSGGKYTNGAVAVGGGGGSPGGFNERWITRSEYNTNTFFGIINDRPAGGASQTTNSSAGLAGAVATFATTVYIGTAGTFSNSICHTQRGIQGSGGASGSGGAGGSANASKYGQTPAGASASTSGAVGPNGPTGTDWTGSGGAAGGGITSGDVASNGGNSTYYLTWVRQSVADSNGGAAPGGAGSDLILYPSTAGFIPVAGAAGGASSTVGNGGAGADGTRYGQAGGGGGAARDGVGNSGAGGAGGPGAIKITIWY